MQFHLSLVGLAQADDMHHASAGREHHSMQSVTDKSEHSVPALAVDFPIILFDHRVRPVKLRNQ